jgi:hypothetical protein
MENLQAVYEPFNPSPMSPIKKHVFISLMAYMYLGFGCAIQQTGLKAFGLWPTIIIFSSSLIVFMIVMFTSLQKVKDWIKETEKSQTNDHQ